MDPEGIWEPRDATQWVHGRERIKIQIIGFLIQGPIFLGFIITVFSLSCCSWLTGKKPIFRRWAFLLAFKWSSKWFEREKAGGFKLEKRKESRMAFPGWNPHSSFCLGQILECWTLSLSFILLIDDQHTHWFEEQWIYMICGKSEEGFLKLCKEPSYTDLFWLLYETKS